MATGCDVSTNSILLANHSHRPGLYVHLCGQVSLPDDDGLDIGIYSMIRLRSRKVHTNKQQFYSSCASVAPLMVARLSYVVTPCILFFKPGNIAIAEKCQLVTV